MKFIGALLIIIGSGMISMIVKRLLFIAAIAFGINYIWENLQMAFYVEMNYSEIRDWLYCLKSSGWDAVIISGIYILGSLIFKKWNWVEQYRAIKLVYMILTGAAVALVIEMVALNSNRWSYTEIMPLIPRINVGIVPILQLMILPFLTYLMVYKYILPTRDKR
jgi:hypothetical protein